MAADPEPDSIVAARQGKRAIVAPNTDRINFPDPFEVERRMPRIHVEKLEILIRNSLNG